MPFASQKFLLTHLVLRGHSVISTCASDLTSDLNPDLVTCLSGGEFIRISDFRMKKVGKMVAKIYLPVCMPFGS